MQCDCDEGKIKEENGDIKYTALNAHDCLYVHWRNSLIPVAEKLASEVWDIAKDHGKWSREFHHMMNQLVEKGVQNL